jgi:hypothetical protein
MLQIRLWWQPLTASQPRNAGKSLWRDSPPLVL